MARRRHKDIYYMMPGNSRSAKHRRRRNWIVTIMVGVVVAVLVGLAIYYRDGI